MAVRSSAMINSRTSLSPPLWASIIGSKWRTISSIAFSSPPTAATICSYFGPFDLAITITPIHLLWFHYTVRFYKLQPPNIDHALAVLAPRKGYKITFWRFKGTKPSNCGFHFVVDSEQVFFQKHLNKSTAKAITYLPFPLPVSLRKRLLRSSRTHGTKHSGCRPVPAPPLPPSCPPSRSLSKLHHKEASQAV